MLLNQFSYYFSVEGNEGGIYSLTFKFIPDNATKKQVKKDFDQLESLLDLQFLAGEHVAKGEKVPTLGDSPAGIETGFKYKGRCRNSLYLTSKTFINIFASMVFLDKLLKVKPIEPLMSGLTTISASLCCHMSRGDTNQTSPVLELNIQAGHNLNLSIFDTILTFPDMNISTSAKDNMRNLRQTLSIGQQIDPKRYLDLEL